MALKIKTNKNKKQQKSGLVKVPRTVQQTIPYISAYPNGIIQTGADEFTKGYSLAEVNFETENDEKQDTIFDNFGLLINSFCGNIRGQVMVFNKSTNIDDFRNDILCKPQKDDLNKYREAINNVILQKMTEGKNNISKEKYLFVSLKANDILAATDTFKRLDSEISELIKAVNGKGAKPMDIEERLAIMHDIMNIDSELSFHRMVCGTDKDAKFSLNSINQHGLTTKDLIGPQSFTFKRDHFKIGETFARALYIGGLPSRIKANIVSQLTDVPCNMVVSVGYEALDTAKARTIAQRHLTVINTKLLDTQKEAAKAMYDPELVAPETRRAQANTIDMLDRLSDDEKLIYTYAVVLVFGKDKKELDDNTEAVKTVATNNMVKMFTLDGQQELCFRSALPLCRKDLSEDILLSTEQASVFIPFSTEELLQKGGYYYGQNAKSKNLVIYNRKKGDNYNGIILGVPGKGKSFKAKEIIASIVLFEQNDQIYVIDPEGEYIPLANCFKSVSQVITIAPGTQNHLNPLDMDMSDVDDKGADPVIAKCDYLVTLIECMNKDRPLSVDAVNMVHRCGRQLYRGYVDHMLEVMEHDKHKTCDRDASPTLTGLYQIFIEQNDPVANALANIIEIFSIGNYDTFAKRTNVNTDARLIVYDISRLVSSGMMPLGIRVCLNDAWNRMIENRKKNIWTWLFMDEFHILLQNENSENYIRSIYKRARKWMGIPTALTQNVEDLLISPAARSILENCTFKLLLSQAPMDRKNICDMLNIPPLLEDYITDKPSGTGLLFTGSTVIPIEDRFPTDNVLFEAFTTKAKEVA